MARTLSVFKILVLQALYDLSDDQAEYVINDRLSFQRFLGLSLGDKVPDAKTIWLFREQLSRAGAVEKLFARFERHLEKAGYLAMGGQIVDASLVAAPRPRNTDGEKRQIKDGRTAAEIWPDDPHKAAQKDTQARWTVKQTKAKTRADGGKHKTDLAIPVFGYKRAGMSRRWRGISPRSHICIDREHGLIRRYKVTDAARYDGAQLADLLDRNNTASGVWADTAYRSKKNETWLARHGFRSHIHTKKPPGKPMSRRAAAANGKRSKIRALVEHPFARLKGPMRLTIRSIGLARAETRIGLANLVYNFQRYLWLESRAAPG